MSNEGTTEETVDEASGVRSAPKVAEGVELSAYVQEWVSREKISMLLEDEPELLERVLDALSDAEVAKGVTSPIRRRLRNCVDALKELGVDPIALEDDGDDREELLRSARDRGVKLVQHGKGLVEGDSRLRDETLRTVLGGAIDGEKTVVDVARRVARDLKNALDRPGAAVVDDEAVKVKARLSGMLYFDSELPPAGPTWGHILAAVEGWRDTLHHLGQMVGAQVVLDPNFLRRLPATVLFDPTSALLDELRTARRELEALRASGSCESGSRILVDVIALKCDPVWQHRGIAKVQVQLGTINDIGEWEEADNCAGLQLGRAELVYKS